MVSGAAGAADLGGRSAATWPRQNIVLPPTSPLSPTSRARTHQADRRHHQDQDRDRGAADRAGAGPAGPEDGAGAGAVSRGPQPRRRPIPRRPRPPGAVDPGADTKGLSCADQEGPSRVTIWDGKVDMNDGRSIRRLSGGSADVGSILVDGPRCRKAASRHGLRI
jgi:hypothetical protein